MVQVQAGFFLFMGRARKRIRSIHLPANIPEVREKISPVFVVQKNGPSAWRWLATSARQNRMKDQCILL